jgi:hypothetical protein
VTTLVVIYYLVLWPAGVPRAAHIVGDVGPYDLCMRALDDAIKRDERVRGVCLRRTEDSQEGRTDE